jgi:hypothetical protein
MTAERAHDSVEHLRAAARELIAAARAALDVAEDIVDDPSVVRELTERRPAGTPSWVEQVVAAAGSFGPLGDLVRTAAATAGRPHSGEGPAGPGDGGERSDGGPEDPPVERIVIR